MCRGCNLLLYNIIQSTFKDAVRMKVTDCVAGQETRGDDLDAI